MTSASGWSWQPAQVCSWIALPSRSRAGVDSAGRIPLGSKGYSRAKPASAATASGQFCRSRASRTPSAACGGRAAKAGFASRAWRTSKGRPAKLPLILRTRPIRRASGVDAVSCRASPDITVTSAPRRRSCSPAALAAVDIAAASAIPVKIDRTHLLGGVDLRLDGEVRIVGPLHHRAVIHLGLLVAEDLGRGEPAEAGPVAGIAEVDLLPVGRHAGG